MGIFSLLTKIPDLGFKSFNIKAPVVERAVYTLEKFQQEGRVVVTNFQTIFLRTILDPGQCVLYLLCHCKEEGVTWGYRNERTNLVAIWSSSLGNNDVTTKQLHALFLPAESLPVCHDKSHSFPEHIGWDAILECSFCMFCAVTFFVAEVSQKPFCISDVALDFSQFSVMLPNILTQFSKKGRKNATNSKC